MGPAVTNGRAAAKAVIDDYTIKAHAKQFIAEMAAMRQEAAGMAAKNKEAAGSGSEE
jgi:hypothetical protein